jgi:phage tail tape-measure protein
VNTVTNFGLEDVSLTELLEVNGGTLTEATSYVLTGAALGASLGASGGPIVATGGAIIGGIVGYVIYKW